MKSSFPMKNSHMRNQLVFLFFLIIMVSVSTITLFMINRTNKLLKENSIEVHTRMIEQTVSNINNSISSIDKYYNYLLSNRAVLRGLLDEDFGTNPETYESVLYLKDLMFSLITSNEGLDSALYISREGAIVSSLSGIIYPDFFRLPQFNESLYTKDIYDNPADEAWYVGDIQDTHTIYYLRGIREPVHGEILGILSFLVKDDLFLNQISKLSVFEGGVYLCDRNGFIFLHSSPEKKGGRIPIDPVLLESKKAFTLEDNNTLFIVYPTLNSWFVISEIPKENLYGDIKTIIQWGIYISIIFIFFGSLVSLYIAHVYTGDLTVLVDAMYTSSHGNLETISIHGSNLEFKSLALTYNNMIGNLDTLTENLKNEIINKTKIEDDLRVLNDTLESKVQERTAQLEDSLETLRETQSFLVEKEKMASLGSLVAGVAHEINTPVGVCITASSHQSSMTSEIYKAFSSKKALSIKEFDRFLKKSESLSGIIETNLNRVAVLIRSFKKIAVDQTYENEQTINLNDYIQSIMLSLSPETKSAEVEILCPSNLYMKTFPGAIGQILTNLVMNSLIHGFIDDRIQTVKITVEQKMDNIKIIYCDNGVGMDKGTITRIFDPFFTTNRTQGGTGLGMHIVYNLVTQHLGGQIGCESTPGNGTTFTIILPLNFSN